VSTGTADALSPREREVLAALAGHATNAEIAERLFLSVRTVESHVASLLRKTGARDRRALAGLAVEPAASAPPVASTLTSFIGRAHERAALAVALGEHRLVTALGPGGVGKTRLAFSVAADLAERYPEGSWLVDLVPITDPARIAPTIAERIGVQERQGRAPVDALEAWLSTRTTLLVLDNCEHLLDPVAELLERLLAGCPGLTVLATSRTRLAVPFEWVFPVPGLSAGPDGDAAALFTARALAAGTRLTDADRERVGAICTGLEGVALAIELAAARLPSLGLDGLEAGLGDRLALLTGGRRADARHRSLRAAVDWSHDLLAPEERAVLRRVSVFATPFPATAAADVVAALPGVTRGAVPGALAALVDCSLLDAVSTNDGTRYRALETIRQYGAELLEAERETTAVRSAHLRWCMVHAEQLPVEAQDDERWTRDVDALADEARTALARDDLPAADREGAFRLAERIARLVFARGIPAEAQRRFEQAAVLAADPASRGRMLVAAAGAAEARQFGAPSIRLRGEAARAFREAGDDALAAVQLAREAEAMVRFRGIITPRPEPEAAEPVLDEARPLAGGDPRALARIAVAEILGMHDEDPAKESAALDLLPELERLDDRVGRSSVLDGICTIRLARGDLTGAFAAASERIELLAPLGISPEIGAELTDALQMTAECAIGVGDIPAARRLSGRLLTLPSHAGEGYLAVSRAIIVAAIAGDVQLARDLGVRFLDGWERAGRPRVNSLSPTAMAVGCAAALQGDDDDAARWLGIARALLTRDFREQYFEVLVCRLLPLLHGGDSTRALDTAATAPDGRNGRDDWYENLWRPWYAALRTEVAVIAAVPGAAGWIAAARSIVEQNPVTALLVDRADALLREDGDGLPAIADRLEALGARYQAARTRIMAGGALRERGEGEMAACGAAPMTWPLG
jgi:predicted ATPase/DNA-binding CsgD family transcriptional regulator